MQPKIYCYWILAINTLFHALNNQYMTMYCCLSLNWGNALKNSCLFYLWVGSFWYLTLWVFHLSQINCCSSLDAVASLPLLLLRSSSPVLWGPVVLFLCKWQKIILIWQKRTDTKSCNASKNYMEILIRNLIYLNNVQNRDEISNFGTRF